MNKLILSVAVILLSASAFSQSNYTAFGGNNSAFNAKYKVTVDFNEKTGILTVSGDAPFMNVMLTGYTHAQYAVRKGSVHAKYFPTKVRKFSFDLKVPGLKDRYYYWLKLYTEDGTLEEYLYKRKDSAPAVDEAAQEAEGIETVDETESSKYEFYDKSNRDRVDGKTEKVSLPKPVTIKTNISCINGKAKVIAELMKLDGVMKVTIDIKTGNMLLYYSTDGTPYETILETITDQGFSADKKAKKPGKFNPCFR